jgi:hypothetical protein
MWQATRRNCRAGEDVKRAPTDGKFCADGLGGERLHQMQKSSGWFFPHRNNLVFDTRLQPAFLWCRHCS